MADPATQSNYLEIATDRIDFEWNVDLEASVLGVVLCMARPEAVSQAKPGPSRPSQAGPKWWLHDGFGLA